MLVLVLMLKEEDSAPDSVSIANMVSPAAPPPPFSSSSPPNSISRSARVIINNARAWAGPLPADDILLLEALIDEDVTEDENLADEAADTDSCVPCVSVAGATVAACGEIMPVG